MDYYQSPYRSQGEWKTLPPNEIHAVSVSVPSWLATVNEDRLKDMRNGHPRFFIHKFIEALAERICGRLVSPITEGHDFKPRVKEYEPQVAQMAMLFPSKIHALQCEQYLEQHTPNTPSVVTHCTVSLASSTLGALEQYRTIHWEQAELHAVLYPPDLYPRARKFWQYTGYGISSRYAEFCKERVDDLKLQPSPGDSKRNDAHDAFSIPKGSMSLDAVEGSLSEQAEDEKIKSILRRRIANLASSSDNALEEKDVYIFSCGMSAISTVAQVLQAIGGWGTSRIVVAYGLLYHDTIKTLLNVSGFRTFVCENPSSAELDLLESQLKKSEHITALFCEFPGNTSLVTPDLRRLRTLAKTYDFMIICDDTLGTFVNVDILSSVDIVCTSLTKLFSGGCNVMGGSVILNPQGKRYKELQSRLSAVFVDTYFPADAILMEANSRDFSARVKQASANAEAVCALLRPHGSVTKVYYPKHSSTQALYDAFRRPQGGYGFLLSVSFKDQKCALEFFDALRVDRGPSLGTNFTLACPYTLFELFGDRKRTKKLGVSEYTVRISVGLEEPDALKEKIEVAFTGVELLALMDQVNG